MEERWRGWDNAEIYDRFVREHRIYDWLNERLVERADLGNARHVLDLGCGTGATVQACLRRIPSDAQITGVDASAEMVGVAEANSQDPRAHFVVTPVGDFAERVAGPFDRAVSNAAFWMFPRPGRVFAALAESLVPGALLVFNVPAERTEQDAAGHPFQVALASAIADHSGEPFVRTAPHFDLEAVCEQAAAAGFATLRIERLVYEGPQGELMELMEIPAMIEPLTVGMGAEQTRRALAQARSAADPEERVPVAWLYVTLRRR